MYIILKTWINQVVREEREINTIHRDNSAAMMRKKGNLWKRWQEEIKETSIFRWLHESFIIY